MFHTSYMGDDINARAFLTLGAGGLTLASAAVMSYYASAEDDYRYGYFANEAGDIPLWGDARFLLAAGSLFIGPALYMRGMMGLASAVGILGAGSLFSLASSEGQRWQESGEFFGLKLPALPAMEEKKTEQIAAPSAAA